MATNLLTPILNDLTRSVNFFNGRLLTGEDLTTEQRAARATRALLGQAAGDGVAFGLEVSASAAGTITAPVVTIKQGLALNRNGGSLFLSKDTDIGLVRPATTTPASGSTIFQDCTPVQSGPYVAGAGVYLLTVGPASGTQGLAEVSGIGTSKSPCNSKYNTDGVQFRLIPIDLTIAELDDANHLRNLVAYKCFNPAGWTSFLSDPFGDASGFGSSGLIDQLRASQLLTDCEVPLATLFWTATGGLLFVDNWSARRPIIPRGSQSPWGPLTNPRHAAEGLAMFLQFQAQVGDMLQFGAGATPLISVVATDYFNFLPPVGIIPIGSVKGSNGFDYLQFFTGRTYQGPTFIEGAVLQRLVSTAALFPPIDFSNAEMIWLYRERENMESIATTNSSPAQAFMVFTNGHVPFAGEAQYNLNYFNYANYV